MTIEQAKSELMQMYGALAPNKQIAIDMLIKASVKSQESQIRPKGHWREVDTNMYACSKCSHVLAIDPLVNSISEMNTCPFCSTKMEGAVGE